MLWKEYLSADDCNAGLSLVKDAEKDALAFGTGVADLGYSGARLPRHYLITSLHCIPFGH